MKNLGEEFVWFFGVVEDRADPLKLGRVRVRCYGWHTEDKREIPTEDLPWAQPMQPITSGAMGDIGRSPTGLVEGSWVIGFFADGKEAQRPIIMGSMAGIPVEEVDPTKGFNDPNGIYPSRIEEPDVNRLARNDNNQPHDLIESKTAARVKNVPIAFSSDTWNEPVYAYNAAYPKNHVYQTESGHIIEIDDTASGERIHQYHKAGSFYEIDAVGNRTVRIQGNDFQIVLGNGNLYVDGNLNITVAGKLNVKCEEFNVEVNGNVNKTIGGSETSTINGSKTEQIVGSKSSTSGSLNNQVNGTYDFSVSGESKEKFMESYSVRYENDYSYHYGKDVYERHDAGVNYSCPLDPPRTSDTSCSDIEEAPGPSAASAASIDNPDAEIGTPSFATVGGSKNFPTEVTTRLDEVGNVIFDQLDNVLGAIEIGGPSAGAIVSGTLEASNLNDAVIAEPTSCDRPDLGSVSEIYESNGKPGAIGFDSTGGYSYGSYQIATRTGTFNSFMTFLRNRFSQYHARLETAGGAKAALNGTPSFHDVWRTLSQESEFAKAQHDFIQATHYDLAVGKIQSITGIDLCDGSHTAGLQDAVWSTAVQHGPTGATRIFQRALEATGKSASTVTDSELISAIYDERGANNGLKYFGSSTPAVRNSVVARFESEKQMALSLA